MSLFGNKKKSSKKTEKEKEEEAKYFADKGQKVAEYFKLHEKVTQINTYGQKHPKKTLGIIGGVVICSFIIGFFIPTPRYGGEEIKQGTIEIGNTKDLGIESRFQKEIGELYNELETLYIDAEALIKKENKTRQDSAILATKLLRMEEIDKILNTQFKDTIQ